MTNTPLADPSVTVTPEIWMKATGVAISAPRPLIVKFSLVCQYYADKWGVPLETLIADLRAPGSGKLAITLDLFAAMVSQNFVDSHQAVPRPEMWANAIPEEDIPEISKAVFAALKKHLLVSQRPTAPAETAEAPKVQ